MIVPRIISVTMVALCLTGGAALGHTKLKSATPAANSTAGATLKEIRLEFSEAIEPALSKIELDDAKGQPVASAFDCTKAVCALPVHGLVAGTYSVKYHVLSGDGHVVDGGYDFTVTGGSP